jgi:hypothetical protein
MRAHAGLEDRLLDDQHVVVLGGAAEEVLRALPDEIPTKMRETDQKRLFRTGFGRRTKGIRLRHQTLMHSANLRERCVVTIGQKNTVRGE